MARLPTIFLNFFKFTLHQGIFDQVPCFFSLNPSLDTHGVTGLFLQLRHASGTLYHLILLIELGFVPQHSNLFSKLMLQVFQGLIFVVSVFLLFVFWFLVRLEHQAGCKCALQVLLLFIIITQPHAALVLFQTQCRPLPSQVPMIAIIVKHLAKDYITSVVIGTRTHTIG